MKALIKEFWAGIRRLKEHMRQDKGVWRLYLFLRLSVIAIAVRAAFIRNYESLSLCILVLLLFLVPSFLERKLKIDFPSTMEKIILLFIYAAEILGEIAAYYVIYPWWDTVLHTMNGFLCAAIGFALVDILNENEKIKFELSPLYCAIVAFCFSMTIGVLWEFFEFGMDYFLHFDMQKDTIVKQITSVMLDPAGGNHTVTLSNIESVVVNGQELGLGGYLDIGLYDTMEDLLVNFVGAVTFSVFGYIHVRSKGKNKLAKKLIPTKVRE